MTKSRRVLLKLSGEAFGGGVVDLDPPVARDTAGQIVTAVHRGVEAAVVVGGGSSFKGVSLAQAGVDRPRADYMGMPGTVINAPAFQDSIEQAGVPARVQSVITTTQVAEPCISLHAIRYSEKGRVAIFGAGASIPYSLTDTVSVQWTLEAHCGESLVVKNGVDGVHDDNPRVNPEAKKLDFVTYSDALAHKLKTVDLTALILRRDNGLKARIFGVSEPGSMTTALLGERIGTLVTTDN